MGETEYVYDEATTAAVAEVSSIDAVADINKCIKDTGTTPEGLVGEADKVDAGQPHVSTCKGCCFAGKPGCPGCCSGGHATWKELFGPQAQADCAARLNAASARDAEALKPASRGCESGLKDGHLLASYRI
jgi:hypothetical protein